ncbi:hypothetical protein GCM10011575_30310 [Microlunatus endophyticus]|uniref:Lipoprotein n=1 Tax=Microlunatus endophyticus TaxID=1716077 RepID=A0A917W6S0_9ACTN|nr:hypothetical protein GCM10011575_30310 [Microlunatus endophyticus]
MHRRLAAATTICATLLLAACTQHAPQPPPPPSPGPTMPSDPPTSASPASSNPTPGRSTPTTSEHADLLKVQSLYKDEFASETQVLKHGGADRLPLDIRRRTAGSYQQEVLQDFRSTKKSHTHLEVGGRLLGIAMDKWSPARVTFQSCEDYSGAKSVDKHGKPVDNKQGVRVVQKFTAVKHQEAWLFSSVTPKVVKDFRSAPCDGNWYS